MATVGRELLEAATKELTARSAVQVVVVCGHLDAEKRAALTASGLTIASEWYVGTTVPADATNTEYLPFVLPI